MKMPKIAYCEPSHFRIGDYNFKLQECILFKQEREKLSALKFHKTLYNFSTYERQGTMGSPDISQSQNTEQSILFWGKKGGKGQEIVSNYPTHLCSTLKRTELPNY